MREFPIWIDNNPRKTGRTAAIRSPWTGTVEANVAVAGREDVEAAIASATRAFEITRRASSGERSGWLQRMAEGLERTRDAIADEISREAGKPITMARAEVDRAVLTFRFASEEARRIEGRVLPLDVTTLTAGRFGITRRFPKGVVAGIVPFNFPLNLAAHKVAPALAAGCTIVLKPPPQAPGPTLFLGELAKEAGVPNGAVNVVFADVADAAPLIDDPRVQVLSFTGSAAVGWGLKARAAKKTVILELGGNAAVLVDRSADLAFAAARCALGGYGFAGQVCIKPQRTFVERRVYDEFRERLLNEIAVKVVTGDPAHSDVVCGPVIDDRAAERIEQWTSEAVDAGAKLLTGGGRKDRLLTPALLENAPPTTRVFSEEVFGPVMTLDPFDRFEDALERINTGRYGLQAGVFTNDLPRALTAFETIDTGAVILNDAPNFRVDPMPYGGIKESGFGREGLEYAIEDMTEPKLLVLPPSRRAEP